MPQLFYAYATQDARFRDQLEATLRGLRQRGVLADWQTRAVGPGSGWRGEASPHATQATVVLLLVSRDFVASDYCHGDDVRLALERQRRGEARVFAVLLRPCSVKDTPLAGLATLPAGGKPVTAWRSGEAAFEAVAAGIAAAFSRREAAAAGTPVQPPSALAVPGTAPSGSNGSAVVAAPAGGNGPAPAEVALQPGEIGAEYVPLDPPAASPSTGKSGARYVSVASLGASRTRTRRVAQLVDRVDSPKSAVARLEAAVRGEVAKGGRVDPAPAAIEPGEPGVACRRVQVEQPARSVSIFAAKGSFLVAAKVVDGVPGATLPEDAATLAETVVRRMLARIPAEVAPGLGASESRRDAPPA